jgi:predicted MPP superfamily phosphohydrolase
MSFLSVVMLFLALIGLISWLNCHLLSRLFPFYRGRMVRYSWLLITVTAILITHYSWVRRLSSLEPGHEIYYLLLYGAIAWLCGQFALVIFQPFLYVTVKLLQRPVKVASAAENNTSGTVMTRRSFLRGTAAMAPLISTGIGIRGIYQAQAAMAVRQYALSIPGLSSGLSGFKIGQVSDTHLGPYFSLERLDSVVALLVRQKPDLVVITGDFVDDMNLLASALERLDQLQPLIPQGIYFCLGNHEYIRNVNLVRAALAKSRVVLLENSSRLILPGPQPFYLLGVDYPGRGMDISADRRRQCFTAANQGIPADAFKVLIAHHPDFLFDGFAGQIPLTLAGHTHGGQVVIGGKSLFYSRAAYIRGLYRENGVYGYVSSGAGHWFPFRLGCPPEVSIFTLQA